MNASSPASVRPGFCLVVALKFGDSGTFAFEEAVRIARRIPGCALHVVHVATKGEVAGMRALADRLRLYLNEKVASLGGLGGITLGMHLREGEPPVEIARFGNEVAADLILLGSTKARGLDWYAAKTVEHVMAETSRAVLVAGPKPPATAENVAIEPPCDDCLRARAASNGKTWWCSRHAQHTVRPRTYSYQRELPLRSHDSEVIPTGFDLS